MLFPDSFPPTAEYCSASVSNIEVTKNFIFERATGGNWVNMLNVLTSQLQYFDIFKTSRAFSNLKD